MVFKVVFLRHGESVWNSENRFTGWTDVGLSELGQAEAHAAAAALTEKGFKFDAVHTSYLRRAISTAMTVVDDMDLLHIPVCKSWRLNERHYGALQGLNKAETAEKHGEAQVKLWRRSYAVPPPALERTDERFPGNQDTYKHVPFGVLPTTESLELCVERVLPYWYDQIAPAILEGKSILVAAHGNSLRALVKHLDDMSEEDVIGLNIPTGVPLVYELDAQLKPINHYYLLDEGELQARMAAVANQASKK